MHVPRMFRRNARHAPRRGVIALLCILLLSGLSVVALALASEVGLQLRMTSNVVDAHQAALNSRSGIEYALYSLRNIIDRDEVPADPSYTRSFAGGSFTVVISDTDGDLFDNPIDPVTITSTGTKGNATRTFEATALPKPHPATRYAACSLVDNVDVEDGSIVRGDIRSGKDIKKGNAPLAEMRGNAIVEDGKSINVEFADVDTERLSTTTTMPTPSVDWDWYTTNGSAISPPVVDGNLLIKQRVLSPTSNPLGSTNAAGIYWLDAGGKEVIITDTRIYGTLIVLDSRKVRVHNGIWQEPARPVAYSLPAANAGDGITKLWIYPGLSGTLAGQMARDRTYSTDRTTPGDDDPDADSIVGTTIHNHNDTSRNDLADKWEYEVLIPSAGNWYAWCRYYAPGPDFDPADPRNVNNPNSFYVSISGGITRAGMGNLVTDSQGLWGWKRWLWGGHGPGGVLLGDPDPLSLGNLTKGLHTITVYDRNTDPIAGGGVDSPRLDILLLTDDVDYRPSDADVPWLEEDLASCDGASYYSPYATLMVQGDLTYFIDEELSEHELNVDFDEDGTIAGVHPNVIRGLIYATGTAKVFAALDNDMSIDFVGCVIADKVHLRGEGCTIRHDPQLASQLIVGFQGPGFEIVAGTLKEVR